MNNPWIMNKSIMMKLVLGLVFIVLVLTAVSIATAEGFPMRAPLSEQTESHPPLRAPLSEPVEIEPVCEAVDLPMEFVPEPAEGGQGETFVPVFEENGLAAGCFPVFEESAAPVFCGPEDGGIRENGDPIAIRPADPKRGASHTGTPDYVKKGTETFHLGDTGLEYELYSDHPKETPLWTNEEKKKDEEDDGSPKPAKVNVGANFTFIEGMYESSLFHTVDRYDGEYYYIKLTTDFGKRDASYDVGAGGGYDNEKGSYYLRVYADGKAEIVFLSAELEARLGTDDINLTGKGSATVLEGQAKGKGKIGYEEGKVIAKLDLNAEFNLVDLQGKLSGKLLGVKAAVKGAFKVGAGLHMKVSFKNGKLTFNLGAALGIGVDLGFSIDVNEAIENTARWLKETGEDIVTTAQQAYRGLKESFFGFLKKCSDILCAA